MVGIAIAISSCTDTLKSPLKEGLQNPGLADEYLGIPDTISKTLVHPSYGQEIYIPVYSQIYDRTERVLIDLTTTMSIRNVDPDNSLIITEINYHGQDGSLLQEYLDKPIILAPLATIEYIISESDVRGGPGGNFMMEWFSDIPVAPPVTESVMISTFHNQGLSFNSIGIVVKERELR